MRLRKTAIAFALGFLVLGAIPAAAQTGRAWLLGDIGAGLAGGGNYTGNAALYADGGVGVAITDFYGISAEWMGLFRPAQDCSVIIQGRCGRAFPQTTGIMLGLVTNDQGIGVLRTSGFVAGVGWFNTRTPAAAPTSVPGLFIGGEGNIVGNDHIALSLSGRAIVLPRVASQTLFIFPITAGVRLW